MESCLFCKIAAGEIPAKIVFESEEVLAFHDIHPQAPTHILIIPKIHITSALNVTADNAHFIAACFAAIAQIAREAGLDNGFRVINNCGKNGGQTVGHLHFHLMGGKKLSEKMLS